MTEWISVKDRLPNAPQDVLVKTDCPDCPILKAMYWDGFILPVLMQCDKHLEPDERDFKFFRPSNPGEMEMFADRITHWMSIF